MVSGQKHGNQTEIITLTHADMTIDVARTLKNSNNETAMANFRDNADILPYAFSTVRESQKIPRSQVSNISIR